MAKNKLADLPLVSIIIPNYNHSMYLDQSIQSALDQTYPNIEVIVSDNNSTDNSLEVVAKYVEQGVVINKNPSNVANLNYRIAFERSSGKYFVLLCADDVLCPEFVEKAVKVMEADDEIGVVHQERVYVDEQGEVTELDPFFSCSFRVKGEKMLPIFMLTDVAQSAQGLIRRSAFELAGYHDTEYDHTNIDMEQWFRLCMYADYAYIREVGAKIRRPMNASQTSMAVKTFYHPIALYVSLMGFVQWGKLKGYDEVVAREQRGKKKLARECINMAKTMLAAEEYDKAKRYLLFMQFVDEEICEEEEYQLCEKILQLREGAEIQIDDYGEAGGFAYHKRGYEPPEGFLKI